MVHWLTAIIFGINISSFEFKKCLKFWFTYGTKYSRMEQVKFVKDSLLKFWRGMVSYPWRLSSANFIWSIYEYFVPYIDHYKLKVLAQKGCGLNISSIIWCKFTTSTYFTVCREVPTPLSPYFIAYFEFDNPTTLGVLSNLPLFTINPFPPISLHVRKKLGNWSLNKIKF